MSKRSSFTREGATNRSRLRFLANSPPYSVFPRGRLMPMPQKGPGKRWLRSRATISNCYSTRQLEHLLVLRQTVFNPESCRFLAPQFLTVVCSGKRTTGWVPGRRLKALSASVTLIDHQFEILRRRPGAWANIPTKRNCDEPIWFSPIPIRPQLGRTVPQSTQAMSRVATLAHA